MDLKRKDGREPGKLGSNRFHEAAWVVGPEEHLKIADDVWIGAFCVIDAVHDVIEIGEGSVIASGAHIYTHSTVRRTRGDAEVIDHAPVKIGHHVSICANAVVLHGVTIGDRAVVGAGAVVSTGSIIGTGEVWGGVPARGISPRWAPAFDTK